MFLKIGYNLHCKVDTMGKPVVQFIVFMSSILIATYSVANMNQMRYKNEITHTDPQPIDESKNAWVETESPVEVPVIKKRHLKNISLQEEYAKLSGLSDWEHKRVQR